MTKDGSRCRIAWDYTPFLVADGTLKYVISTGSDITPKSTTVLPENDALFRSMIEGLAEGVIIADFEEVALYCNDRLSEVTGYKVLAYVFGARSNKRLVVEFLVLSLSQGCINKVKRSMPEHL